MAEMSANRRVVPMEWQVNGLTLKGLSWGEPNEKPLLALHGWLDNAASFAQLAPHLSGYYVVAPDLTGHGLSARRSPDASYQIWDDLPEICGVLDALGWDFFDLIGHSRGAIIATLLASTYPERVRHLVLLDAVIPQPIEEDAFPEQMRKALKDKVHFLSRENTVFPDLQDAVASRVRRGLSEDAAKLLVERNLRACPGGMTWTTDPRLHGASAVKLTKGQIKAVLNALHMPTLWLLAENSATHGSELIEYVRQNINNLALQTIAGGHHFHMESGATVVAHHVDRFLSDMQQTEYI